MTKFTVPYLYEALYIKPKCRKSSFAAIKDETEIEITELSAAEMPVAFRIGEYDHRHFDGTQLWAPVRQNSDEDAKILTVDVLKDATKAGMDANNINLFNRVWQSNKDTMFDRHCHIRYSSMSMSLGDGQSRSDIEVREWIDDNKDAVMATIRKVAEGLRIVDGVIYRKSSEPYYHVMTFGMGGNHGGTGLFVGSGTPHEGVFNALQKDRAHQYGNSVALARGDDKSTPISTNGTEIEVLIPEAVLIPANKWRSDEEIVQERAKGGVVMTRELLDVLAAVKAKQQLAVIEMSLPEGNQDWLSVVRNYFFDMPSSYLNRVGLEGSEDCLKAIVDFTIPDEWFVTKSSDLSQFRFSY
ncbi:hypothetical protein AB4254_10855 [Vibrio breoganii]